MRTDTIHSVHPAETRLHAWDEDDLIARLTQSLDHAERAIRQLDEESSPRPASLRTDLRPDQRPEDLVRETALLLLAASSLSSYSAIGPRILRVATLLIPHARGQHILRSICFEPAVAFEHATAHICLKRLGFYDCDFDAMLDLAAASHAADGRGRTPHRTLEQEWLKQSWLYPEGMRRLRCGPHIAASALNRTIDLLHGSRKDVSAFTHAVMHMTDYNIFPRNLPRCRETLLAEAEAMLARALEQQDYDLTAEILVTWPLTGETWSPAAAFAFRVLARVHDAATSAPAPSNVQRVSAIQQRHLRPAALSSIYGMGLLCAAALNDQRMPPASIPYSTARAGALEAVLDLIDLAAADGPRPHWQMEFDSLTLREQQSLAEFLLSIALHRDFRRRDLSAMKHLLEVGQALGLANNPLASQATEMMTRVAQFADCISCNTTQPAAGIPACA